MEVFLRRSLRFAWKTWGIIRHLLSIRSVLQIAHWWEPVTAAAIGLSLGIWAHMKTIPLPVAALMGLVASYFLLAFWRLSGNNSLIPIEDAEERQSGVGSGTDDSGGFGPRPEVPATSRRFFHETLRDQMLQADESEIVAGIREYDSGLVVAVKQVLSSEKALGARIVVLDIRPLQDGKLTTSRLLHSEAGNFSYDAIQLQRAPGIKGDLHYGEEGVWWLLRPIKGMQNLLMFWPDRPGFRPVALQPGKYIANLTIWVGDRNIPFQAAWSIDAEQRATIS